MIRSFHCWVSIPKRKGNIDAYRDMPTNTRSCFIVISTGNNADIQMNA